MIGLLIIAHGRLADEFKKTLEHVIGPQEACDVMAIQPEDSIETRRDELCEKIKKIDQGQGVILLTDLFGGTPSNLAISLLDEANVEVIAGVNMPMLIKLASIRKDVSIEEAISQAQEAGKKYIHVASKLLVANG